jgi:hypothetical protein
VRRGDSAEPNRLGNPQSLNRYSYCLNNPLKYTDPSGHEPITILIGLGLLALKAVDYGWTAWDVYRASKILNDPDTAYVDRIVASLDVTLAIALEVAEPDDASPVALPADDIARKGAISAARKALREGNEEALEELPGWLRPIVRGLVTEDKVLTALGRQGKKRVVEGRVGDEIVKTIPDFIDDTGKVVGEIKDVASLGWERQIRTQFEWAQRNGYSYELFIRRDTEIRGELADYIATNAVKITYIDEVIP